MRGWRQTDRQTDVKKTDSEEMWREREIESRSKAQRRRRAGQPGRRLKSLPHSKNQRQGKYRRGGGEE
eukprot:97580-Hanusia_phi.AAC.1